MSTWKIVLICLAVGIAIGAVSGGGIAYKIFKCPEAIQEPNPPEHENNPPKNQDQIKDFLKRDIEIIAKQKSNLFHIEAFIGNYKRTKQDFPLVFPKQPTYHHTIQLLYGYIYNIEAKQFRHTLEGLYFYSWGHVGIGGGAMVTFMDGNVYDVGPLVGAQMRFL
jgi:hypothetical protein